MESSIGASKNIAVSLNLTCSSISDKLEVSAFLSFWLCPFVSECQEPPLGTVRKSAPMFAGTSLRHRICLSAIQLAIKKLDQSNENTQAQGQWFSDNMENVNCFYTCDTWLRLVGRRCREVVEDTIPGLTHEFGRACRLQNRRVSQGQSCCQLVFLTNIPTS